ncbi:hypothetical protein BC829DRAFT_44619 [Chytridium lagenaria]|nr:hypothetical protein BC829DRAFT_44619 [Chytridium lagenaria]
MPEPDLPILYITEGLISSVKSSMPEPLDSIAHRLKFKYGLNAYEINVLLENYDSLPFFREDSSWKKSQSSLDLDCNKSPRSTQIKRDIF